MNDLKFMQNFRPEIKVINMDMNSRKSLFTFYRSQELEDEKLWSDAE